VIQNACHKLKNAIQIAGVIDQAEAAMLLAAGVEYLGFPLRLPDGREDLDEDEAAWIIRSLPADVEGVCITYLSRAAEIIELCDALGARWVQLHGEIAGPELLELRNTRPELSVIKSLIVRSENLNGLDHEINAFSELVDAFITDTFDPGTGRTGATGLTHDWAVSRRIVALSPRPVILAGGLHPDNVRQAIVEVRPAAVDAHTGVEGSDGRKDPDKVAAFVREARAGFRQTPARGR
jgi:phosphoribosylanthranilate isomerase